MIALALVLGTWGSGAAPLTTRLRETGYVRLSEWAKWQGLQWSWLKSGESFVLSNKSVRLQFAVNSRAARFNGVQVWMLYPLAQRDGDIYLSQLDADATFRPLLTPRKNEVTQRVRTICLDAGHGGKDPGNRAFGKQEKDYTLRLVAEIRDQLQKKGFKVVTTRSSDKFLELSDRPAVARQRKADLFVSLHFNGTGGDAAAAQGSETYALTPVGAASTNAGGAGAGADASAGNRNDAQNFLLAFLIQKSLVRTLGSEDRGVRRARFEVLREATTPAVLVEAGFLSHPVEGKKIFSTEYRKRMARAIVEGIQDYKSTVER